MNKSEYKSWGDTRKRGLVVYALSKSAMWMVLITIIKWIITSKIDILSDWIFFIGLIIGYSATWFVNERRFKEYNEIIE